MIILAENDWINNIHLIQENITVGWLSIYMSATD